METTYLDMQPNAYKTDFFKISIKRITMCQNNTFKNCLVGIICIKLNDLVDLI